MIGKREFWRARSSSCGVGDGVIAGVVLRDVGCSEELTSPVSFPVPADISKSGTSPLAAVASKAVIGPLARRQEAMAHGSGLLSRVPADPRRLARQVLGPHSSPRRPAPSSAASGCEVSRRTAPISSSPYVSHGLRSRAEDLVSIELGPKPEHEIRLALAREVDTELLDPPRQGRMAALVAIGLHDELTAKPTR
jgi:hypothetical protein